jgi:hypothetical protein
MIGILQKTWKKMSKSAHDHALALPFSETEKRLIGQALVR